MSFHITHRHTGKLLFTADIDATETMCRDIKRGIAAKWAAEYGISLAYANLERAVLAGYSLKGIDFSYADLTGANFAGAFIQGCKFEGSCLQGVNFAGAEMRDTNLNGSHISDAELEYFQQDFIAEVMKVPDQLEYLRDHLIAGDSYRDGKIHPSLPALASEAMGQSSTKYKSLRLLLSLTVFS